MKFEFSDQRELTVQLRREQDLAYQVSLEADRAKAMVKEEEERMVQMKLIQQEKRIKGAKNRHLKWTRCLPVAPICENGKTVQLSLKMPQGTRVSRVFDLDDSVKVSFEKNCKLLWLLFLV